MPPGSYQKHELILVSAESPEELKRKAEHLARVAERISRAELTDLSAALSHAPQTGSLRLADPNPCPVGAGFCPETHSGENI